MGRHTKLTPELQARIVKMVEGGAFPSVAAVACGISEGTHYEWLQRGTNPAAGRGFGDDEHLYAGYVQAIKRAEAKCEVEVVQDTRGKMGKSKNPIHGFIFLSRRYRDRWAETVNVAVAGREAMAAMERIKEAFNAPAEVVEGEYRDLDDGSTTKLEAAPDELVGSYNTTSANPSEASASLGFHSPPPEDLEAEPAEATAEAEPDSLAGQPDNNELPPTNLLPTTLHDPTRGELSETKGVVVGRGRGESELVKKVRARRMELERLERPAGGK